MNTLPLTVISGYLGAGKTTLINRILAEDHGLKLMIMVNDFGAINIDQALIAAQSEDVIALTNGCVCCTMGADLFMALGDALDRRPRPDHLIIEASGIADPMAIANAAIAEPELSYGGVVTLVDGHNIAGLLGDPLIAAQVVQQIKAGDLVLLTKVDELSGEAEELFDLNGLEPLVALGDGRGSSLFLQGLERSGEHPRHIHAPYTAWQFAGDVVIAMEELRAKIAARPRHLFRLKGFVATDEGAVEVQVVGKNVEITPIAQARGTALVGIGLRDQISPEEIDGWWRG